LELIPELDLEIFLKNYSKEPELGLDSRFHLCGTGIRIGIDILQKHLEKKLELKR
jgi:hypothetical protein